MKTFHLAAIHTNACTTSGTLHSSNERHAMAMLEDWIYEGAAGHPLRLPVVVAVIACTEDDRTVYIRSFSVEGLRAKLIQETRS